MSDNKQGKCLGFLTPNLIFFKHTKVALET